MDQEHQISQRVYEAKENLHAADQLIGSYLPFIRSETAKFLKRPPVEGQDDELSIAMIAFHEAIRSYSRGRGAFLHYAALLIRSRLIDYRRKEQRHSRSLSLDTPSEEGATLADSLAGEPDHGEVLAVRDATRAEIEEFTRQMEKFGVTLSDVADNCPRQQRTLQTCQSALHFAREHPSLLEELLRTKRLPLAQLAQGSGAERKTLERHRKYLVALLLAYTNGYEIIRGHLKQVWKGGTAK